MSAATILTQVSHLDAIGGLFGGGSAPAEQQRADSSMTAQGSDSSYQNNSWGARGCENDAKSFTKCLDENQGNMQICGWYLEQLVCCSLGPNCPQRSPIGTNKMSRKPANQLQVNTEMAHHAANSPKISKAGEVLSEV